MVAHIGNELVWNRLPDGIAKDLGLPDSVWPLHVNQDKVVVLLLDHFQRLAER